MQSTSSDKPRAVGITPKHNLVDLDHIIETQNVSFPSVINLPNDIHDSNPIEVYKSYIHLRLQEYISDLTSRLMTVYTDDSETTFIQQNKFVNWLADQSIHFKDIDSWIPEDLYRSIITKSHDGKLVFPNNKIKKQIMEYVDNSYDIKYVKYWADFMENYEIENTNINDKHYIQSFRNRLEKKFEKKLNTDKFSIYVYTLALNLWIDEFKRNCL
ncbi:predicted protein [Candida tropicalis MYA-3404]|uniref:Uncharacterized protein n=1 Tax=Candida tropicalis (strain ATCC MYA-3404 / T1) TaxID=294747 RepID=C5MHV1_CANTT|nr:predicted protein [Candida tropicalis MYA-3404]EER30648.1 predicted protein [Candida tropicalis MYA-3404]KAG4409284.1 hypothetical protein JTP64_002590 [Candida tropicalis]MCP8718014.1 hypothetical protein [Asgard group archaeon]